MQGVARNAPTKKTTMKKKLFAILFLFPLWGLGGLAAFAQTSSSSSVVVTPITADYTATPPTVTFKVSWPADTRDLNHRSKIWLLVDYRRIKNNAYDGGWLRAGIAALPTSVGGTPTLEPGNNKGFWLEGPNDAFAFVATVTVPVTVELTGYAPQFGWCGIASDRPPTAVEHDGYYALYGTPDFIINNTVTESTKAYIGCIYNLTDATGCPGDDLPDMPEITGFTASKTTICRGQSATLTAIATNAASYSFNDGAWQEANTKTVSPSATTAYTLKVRSAGGCMVTADKTITITVNDPPTGLSLTSATVCNGDAATLTASPAGAASYSLTSSDWQAAATFEVSPTETKTYALYVQSAEGCTATLPDAATVTVHPAFSPGAITTASGTATEGTDPNITIDSATDASGGDGSITYQWRRSGKSSATLSLNSSTYPLNNNSTNYSTEGTYYFTRYAHDEFCNTAWAASSGQYTLTVAASCTNCASWTICDGFTQVSSVSHENNTTMNWANADDYCKQKCGGSGWRLPTRQELVCMCGERSDLPGGYESASYWSGTADGSKYYRVYLSGCGAYSTDPSTKYYVKCVK